MPSQAEVMPLVELPVEMQLDIASQVAADRPPTRWRAIGDPIKPLAWIDNRAWWEWHWQRGIDPDKRREPIPPALRRRVIERDGYRCGICGGQVAPDDVHIDHVKPHSLGGLTVESNLQVAHSRCNILKGARY